MRYVCNANRVLSCYETQPFIYLDGTMTNNTSSNIAISHLQLVIVALAISDFAENTG